MGHQKSCNIEVKTNPNRNKKKKTNFKTTNPILAKIICPRLTAYEKQR